MAKVEMNNEIILLRHTVRQARVCVVNKLIKEIKLLQNKHGNEIQQVKYKRKADKLLAEIHVLKTIKEDDISKFGIMDERDLIKILQDQSSSDNDRIMARIVHYKTIYKKIMQFKEKFPDYKKYLTEKTKKSKKLKNKTKIKNDSKENDIQNKNKNIKKQKIETIENVQHNLEDDERNSEVKDISHKRKKSLDTTLEENKLTETKRSCALENEVVEEQPNMTKLCTVTKEATVKKFTEFLVNQDSNEDLQMTVENEDSAGTTSMQNKSVDDFFITKDNQGNYNDYISLSSDIKHEYNAQAKAFSNNRFTKQNEKYKSNTKLNKNQRYNESRYNQNVRNSRNSRYFDKVDKYQNKRFNEETFTRREKRASNKINMNTSKNNLSNVKNTDENLHPSWLAKKKQQEILSQGFQGKKIVFND